MMLRAVYVHCLQPLPVERGVDLGFVDRKDFCLKGCRQSLLK
jgi:hypothetical protein